MREWKTFITLKKFLNLKNRSLQLIQWPNGLLLTMVSLYKKIYNCCIDYYESKSIETFSLLWTYRGGWPPWAWTGYISGGRGGGGCLTSQRGGTVTAAFHQRRRTSVSFTPIHWAGQGCSECPFLLTHAKYECYIWYTGNVVVFVHLNRICVW